MSIHRPVRIAGSAAIAAALLFVTPLAAHADEPAIPDGTIVLQGWSSGTFYSVDPDTLVATPISSSADGARGNAGLDIDAGSGTAYAPGYVNATDYWTIDVPTGNSTQIASDYPDFFGTTGGDLDELGTLWTVYDDAAGSQLATTVRTTGERTDIAATTRDSSIVRVSALASFAGTLYALVYDEGTALHTVNRMTGELSLLHPDDASAGVDTVYATDFDQLGNLWIFDGQQLGRVNVSTGVAEVLGIVDLNGDFSETLAVATLSAEDRAALGAGAQIAATGLAFDGLALASVVLASVAVAAGGVLILAHRVRSKRA